MGLPFSASLLINWCSGRELALSSKSDSKGANIAISVLGSFSTELESSDIFLFQVSGFRLDSISSSMSLKLNRLFNPWVMLLAEFESLLQKDGPATGESSWPLLLCDRGPCLSQYNIITLLDKLSKLIFPSVFSQARQYTS